MSLDRRQFLRVAGAVTGAAAAGKVPEASAQSRERVLATDIDEANKELVQQVISFSNDWNSVTSFPEFSLSFVISKEKHGKSDIDIEVAKKVIGTIRSVPFPPQRDWQYKMTPRILSILAANGFVREDILKEKGPTIGGDKEAKAILNKWGIEVQGRMIKKDGKLVYVFDEDAQTFDLVRQPQGRVVGMVSYQRGGFTALDFSLDSKGEFRMRRSMMADILE